MLPKVVRRFPSIPGEHIYVYTLIRRGCQRLHRRAADLKGARPRYRLRFQKTGDPLTDFAHPHFDGCHRRARFAHSCVHLDVHLRKPRHFLLAVEP